MPRNEKQNHAWNYPIWKRRYYRKIKRYLQISRLQLFVSNSAFAIKKRF